MLTKAQKIKIDSLDYAKKHPGQLIRIIYGDGTSYEIVFRTARDNDKAK